MKSTFSTHLKKAYARRGEDTGRGFPIFLSQRFGVTTQAAREWLKDKNYPRIEILIAMAADLGITVDQLLTGESGPSAGLMFSLAIYTQIADTGLRNGRIVAGTGTIDRDGNVGDIGGIDKKVVAASRQGANIFFAPDNPVTEEAKKADPNAKSNYETALEAAKTIKTEMKIVPVKTLQDAIDYLKNNP